MSLNWERKFVIKTKRSIGEVKPQTKADSELQPMFAGQAPFFAYALLAAVFLLALVIPWN